MKHQTEIEPGTSAKMDHCELSEALRVAKFDLHLSLDLKRNGGERHGWIWFRITLLSTLRQNLIYWTRYDMCPSVVSQCLENDLTSI